MKHTLGTAAKACGVARTTILRAIKSGRISASKDDKGNYAIDPSELHRAFPPVAAEQSAEQAMEQDATEVGTGGTAVLLAKIEGLEAILHKEGETVADLRRRLDQSEEARQREADAREQAATELRRLTLLLTHQPKPEPEASPSPVVTDGKGRLWQKLFGKR